jgi:hypothetical protein
MVQSKLILSVCSRTTIAFERVFLTDAVDDDREKSFAHMRDLMLSGSFLCDIFIGGMEGVENEYRLFLKAQPGSPVFPVASTGAAAANIYQSSPNLKKSHPELQNDVSYINLMRSIVNPFLPRSVR